MIGYLDDEQHLQDQLQELLGGLQASTGEQQEIPDTNKAIKKLSAPIITRLPGLNYDSPRPENEGKEHGGQDTA